MPSRRHAPLPAWRLRESPPGGIPSLVVSPNDRYGSDVLTGDWRAPRRGRSTPTPAEPDLVVEEVETGWVGAVVRVEKAGGMHVVHLEDRRGRTKAFPLGPGFLVDGAPGDAHSPAGCRRDRARGGETGRLADRQRLGGRRGCPRPRRERLADLRRGPPRRRARREGLGRRPARRGRRRRADGRRRRPRRHHRRVPAGPRPSPRRPRRPPRPRHEGGPHRRSGAGAAGPLPAREDPRPPLRRRVAVRAPGAARLAAVAGHPARHVVEARHLRRARAGPTRARPTSPTRGSASSGRCAPTPTSSRRCSRASRSSSTSSPSPAPERRARGPGLTS